MKNKNILTIAIDEPSAYAKECDLCFYPPHAIIDKTRYKGIVYQGLEYVLLRLEFYERSEKNNNNIPNLLVLMGGTDTYNLTLPIIKQIDIDKENFDISVILSDKHKDIELLKEYSQISKHQINIFNKVENMPSFLYNIDFAISQFGTVAYEYLIKNIPAIYIHNDKEESNICNYFIDNSYALENNIENIYISKLFKLSFRKLKIKNRIFTTIMENVK